MGLSVRGSTQLLLPFDRDQHPVVSFSGDTEPSNFVSPLQPQLDELIRKRKKAIAVKKKAARASKRIREKIDVLRFQMSVERARDASRRVSVSGVRIDLLPWREVPLTSLKLDSLAGVGRARHMKLIAAFPTIGDLEAFRIVSGFGELQGFGSITRKKIEGKLIRWLQRFAPEYLLPRSADHHRPRHGNDQKDGVIRL